jgi:exopolyphosphatase/pppGpp-phosphohydrolase
MEEFDFNELIVSDYGLLEGLLIDEAKRLGLT